MIVEPKISPEQAYISYVSEQISNKSPQVAEAKPKVLSLADLCAKTIRQHCDLTNIETYPIETQKTILKDADTIVEWLNTKPYMQPEVVEASAISLLKKENMGYNILERMLYTAEEKLLGHHFDKFILKLNQLKPEEKAPILAKLIETKRKTASSLEAGVLRIQTTTEKVQDFVIHKILLNPWIYYPAGILIGGSICFKLIRLIPTVTKLFKEHIIPKTVEIAGPHIPTPVKEAATTVYNTYFNYKWRILIGSSLAIAFVPRNSRLHKPLKWASEVIWLPVTLTSKIYGAIIESSLWSYRQVVDLTPKSGQSLKDMTERQRQQRLQNEIKQSRKIWVDLVKTKAPVASKYPAKSAKSTFQKLRSYLPNISSFSSSLSLRMRAVPIVVA